MNDGTLKALTRFIRNLTDRDDAEIGNFISEISSNVEFHSQLDAKRNSIGRKQYRRWGWGISQNKPGKLYSVDLEPQSGWLIPDYLRSRWQFLQGASSQNLAPLLQNLGPIDFFLHDSEHSYQNMLWEFQTAWAHLKGGGLLLSHNIDVNPAFSDFCRQVGIKGHALDEMGGLVMPSAIPRTHSDRL